MQTESPRIPLALVACVACQNVYMRGGNREFCPMCGGDPGVLLQDLEGGPEEPAGQVAEVGSTVAVEVSDDPESLETITPQDVGNVNEVLTEGSTSGRETVESPGETDSPPTELQAEPQQRRGRSRSGERSSSGPGEGSEGPPPVDANGSPPDQEPSGQGETGDSSPDNPGDQ